MKRSSVAALAVLLLTFGVAIAKTTTSKHVKQTGGGSSGDSLTAAPDTSDAFRIDRGTTSWYVTAAADSQVRFTVQISHDKTYWYTYQAIDSTSGGGTSKTGAAIPFGDIWMRVILDPIPAPGNGDYGASFVHEVR